MRERAVRRRPRAASRARLLGLGLGLVLALACPRASEAGSNLRCGNRLVSDGDPMEEVFRRCGEPTFRTTSTDFVSFETAPGVVVTRSIPVETWTYNRGPREFVRYLTFRNGRLVNVSEGNYGY